MKTLTINISNEKYKRLKFISRQQDIGTDELIEKLLTRAIAEYDGQRRFLAFASSAKPNDGLWILIKMNKYFST